MRYYIQIILLTIVSCMCLNVCFADEPPKSNSSKKTFTLEEQHAIFDEVIRFNVDGTVVNYDTGLSYSRKYPNLKLIRFYRNDGFDLGFNGLCAGVRKTDLKLLSEINTAIESISMRERQDIMDNVIKIIWEKNN